MVVVLVVASGAAWEPAALGLLGDRSGIVVLKRCVDVDDLLAAASAGQADVAVLGVDAPGLDAAAVDHLRSHAVRPVAIVPSGAAREGAHLRATVIGIRSLVPEDELASLPDVVAVDEEPPGAAVHDEGLVEDPPPPARGRVLAVWGPAGAPGRTTVAIGLAAELARRRLSAVLVDADPYGGAVAQHLGVLDEVSGLLSAARSAAGGRLAESLGSVQRSVGPHLSVVTGLPRADRWTEVRAGVVEHVVDVVGAQAHVVLDTGFNLEHDPSSDFGSRPARNQMTHDALAAADEVVVVGNADPVGLSRLARGLVELRDHLAGAPVRVVVNRMRPTLRWSEKDIAGMVEGFTRLTGLHFLPEDQAAVDRALVAGRTVVEVGDSAVGRALSGVVDALVPGSAPVVEGGRLRRRTASRARPR